MTNRELESATTRKVIKWLLEAYLEAERRAAVAEAERILRGEAND